MVLRARLLKAAVKIGETCYRYSETNVGKSWWFVDVVRGDLDRKLEQSVKIGCDDLYVSFLVRGDPGDHTVLT